MPEAVHLLTPRLLRELRILRHALLTAAELGALRVGLEGEGLVGGFNSDLLKIELKLSKNA